MHHPNDAQGCLTLKRMPPAPRHWLNWCFQGGLAEDDDGGATSSSRDPAAQAAAALPAAAPRPTNTTNTNNNSLHALPSFVNGKHVTFVNSVEREESDEGARAIRRRITNEQVPDIRTKRTPCATPQNATPRNAAATAAFNGSLSLNSVSTCVSSKHTASASVTLRTQECLFVNTALLSSTDMNEEDILRRHMMIETASTLSDDGGDDSEGASMDGARGVDGWTSSRDRLQTCIEAELRRQNTPEYARDYMHNSAAKLTRRLERLSLPVRRCRGDGNCQFRAISYVLFDTEEHHGRVREASVAYLRANASEYAAFVGSEGLREYLVNMGRRGTWGDELTLCGAANAFDCVIHVITSEKQNWYLQYWPKEGKEGSACKGVYKREVFLAYTFPLHYDAVTATQASKA